MQYSWGGTPPRRSIFTHFVRFCTFYLLFAYFCIDFVFFLYFFCTLIPARFSIVLFCIFFALFQNSPIVLFSYFFRISRFPRKTGFYLAFDFSTHNMGASLLSFVLSYMTKKSQPERRERSFASVLVTKSIVSLPYRHFPSFRW